MTSTGRCTAAWLPSTSTGTPIARAAVAIVPMSTTVPSTFDMWVSAISLVRGPTASITFCGSSEPSGSMSTHFSTAPCRSRRKCQGTMLA